MDHRPKLSIIILAYNEAAHIGHCLEAIGKQLTPADEVIVVNNNSTDDTVVIAKQFAFAKIINESTQGMIPARTAGFAAATGDLLARIDAETILPPQWVATVHRLFDGYADQPYALSGPVILHDTGNRFANVFFGRLTFWTYAWGSRLMLGYHTLYGANMVITRAAYKLTQTLVCHPDAREQKQLGMLEDMDIAIHLHQAGGHILYSTKIEAAVSKRGLTNSLRWRFWAWFETAIHHRLAVAKQRAAAE
ncbi:MAG TPA: glycosyltransferase family A protein [Candidatus Acidoferrum sp.]|nr:glycosyltransferase family A protein [Candidatus Acidoferrum sp.]